MATVAFAAQLVLSVVACPGLADPPLISINHQL